MARTAQSARCNHSGPPCHKCIKNDLINSSQRSTTENEQRDTLDEIIDATVEAVIIINDDHSNPIGRRARAMQDTIYNEVEKVYLSFIASARGDKDLDHDQDSAKTGCVVTFENSKPPNGYEKEIAKQNTLNHIRDIKSFLITEYERQEAINNLPANRERTLRRNHRNELNLSQGNHLRFIGGPKAYDLTDTNNTQAQRLDALFSSVRDKFQKEEQHRQQQVKYEDPINPSLLEFILSEECNGMELEIIFFSKHDNRMKEDTVKIRRLGTYIDDDVIYEDVNFTRY